jgi:nucleotide-binding universal stress UspA family protein
MSTTPAPAAPVLVGVVDVAVSEPALAYAADEALRADRDVLVVHVTDEPPGERTPSQAESLLEDASARLRQLTHGAVTVESLAHAAPLVPALVALSRDAALVVLQRRHRTRLQWLLAGSVSAHVAGQAYAPTVWVPEDWHRREVEPHLVVGLDAADDEESDDLLRHAFVRASEQGATLTVVHGWQLSSGYDDAVVDRFAVADWANRYRAALQCRLSALQAEHPQVGVEVEILHLPAAEALAQASKDAALVVLGRGRLAHPLVGHLGSVSRAVMRDAECPVEIIPGSRR